VQSWVESVAATSAMAASSDDPPPGTGWLEICKNADPTGPVSGPFTFTCDVRPAGQARQRVLPRDQGRRWGPDGRVRLSELGRRGALIGRITLVVQRRPQRQGGRRVVAQTPAARPRTEAWRAGHRDGRLTEEARLRRASSLATSRPAGPTRTSAAPSCSAARNRARTARRRARAHDRRTDRAARSAAGRDGGRDIRSG